MTASREVCRTHPGDRENLAPLKRRSETCGLDEAVDGDKLDRYQVSEDDLARDDDADENGISRLGNADEPFDIESLGVIELPNPPRSFIAQFRDAFPPAAKPDRTPNTH